MSVNILRPNEKVRQIINLTQDYLYEQLEKYRTYFTESQNQIQNTITIHLSHILKQQQLYKNTISQLHSQVAQLKEDNSFLRNQFMNSAIKQEQLKKSRSRVLQQNAEKEERMRALAEQVEKIKNYMSQANNIQESEDIIDFDEGEDSPIKANKFEGLETIREVSEHDLSMTMSLQSFKSEMLEDSLHVQSTFETENELISKQQAESKESLGTENYQIQNYQDALMILKSYNSNGRGMKMTKKPMLEAEKTPDEPILKETIKKPEKRANETINKIKKMRKIEDLDIDGKAFNKSNQQNICFQGNQIYNHDHSNSINQSKAEYSDENHDTTIEDKTQSSISINSNKFVSRVKQNLVNLEDPIKKITQFLHNISSATSHPMKKQNIKEQFKRITYVGGLEFVGHCNEFEEPSGFGKLLFNKNVIYQGQWRCGKFHGWGKFILLSFVKQRQKMIIEVDGHFKYGMMEGSVVCTFTTGQKFMGMIKNQSIEKEGTFVSEKGIMTGFWENNRLIYLI